jgi:glycerol-3-phosphate cytidylyltransferase
MKKVLFGGAFDLITTGHIFSIQVAKSLGDYLIVNVVPDNRVRAKKGSTRPIKSLGERLVVIQNIKGVDEAISVPYTEGTSQVDYDKETIRSVVPNVVYSMNDKLEEFCSELGIMFVLAQDIIGIDGTHTTDIVEKVKG